MINYDLPWNPTRLEQRLGRIHRIGQERECHAFNFVATDSEEGQPIIEGRILDARQYPIEGAWVRLTWNDGTDFTVRTGKQGEFTFYLETLGQGVLTAGKEGYGDAPVQEYDLDEDDDDIVPMVLTLNPPGVGDGG